MKKILSICLAALLLVSVVLLAHATEVSPTVVENADAEQPATGSEGYTIEVPARLTPGESSTVTLQGTWASNCIIAVSADKEVLLTNSIRDTEQRTLNVSFPGIDEYGGDTTSQAFTETISVEGITDVLFGTWSGRFAYYVDVINPEDVIEYLQSKYPFKYYSTINLAVSDVNSGKIGTNANSDKDNAAAGIYTDENGNINVVLLKDTVLTQSIQPTKDMTINLGGYTLSTTTSEVAIEHSSGKLVVDGRLPGSTISVTQTTDGKNARAIQCKGELTVMGGTYISDAVGSNAACIDVRAGTAASISDAKVFASDTTGTARAIQILVQAARLTVDNCECTASATKGTAVGIQAQDIADVLNCYITASGGKNPEGIRITGSAEVTVENSNITVTSSNINASEDNSAYGINISKATTSATVDNSDISVTTDHTTGKTFGIHAVGNATVTNSGITASGGSSVNGIEIVDNATVTVTDCDITPA